MFKIKLQQKYNFYENWNLKEKPWLVSPNNDCYDHHIHQIVIDFNTKAVSCLEISDLLNQIH